MALQISYNSDFGVTFSTAYVRIMEVQVNTPLDDANNKLKVVTEVYADNQARLDGKVPVGFLRAEDGFTETNSLSKAELYTWLKTQPGFEGATDVV